MAASALATEAQTFQHRGQDLTDCGGAVMPTNFLPLAKRLSSELVACHVRIRELEQRVDVISAHVAKKKGR